ncbi:hypothetical protein ABIB35_002308 [Arthrobacter sp. UYP6]|uniref:DUF6807 domain-containing protein n=1 Tax=Arthrobacter sp. UYP6 TaxID=1756378 RepID=UPI003392F2BF
MPQLPSPATEPVRTGLSLVHEHDRSLRVSFDGQEIFRYVYGPWDAQFESPRPYFHPLKTLGGKEVSTYRPHDHLWHKGMAWSLPNVGTENFWGGPTYNRGRGYEQLENNGSTQHVDFASLEVTGERITVVENLEWITQAGDLWVREQRRFAVEVLPGELADRAWALTYSTSFTNVSGEDIVMGSPTTKGRENAGYGGLFWRGPRSFTGGSVYIPGRKGGDELNGIRAPWMAFSGQHDGDGGASTVVFVDSPNNSYAGAENTEWFVRTGIFAVVSPSPYYSTELTFEPGQSLSYEYAVVIADLDRGVDGSAQLADASLQLLGSSTAAVR